MSELTVLMLARADGSANATRFTAEPLGPEDPFGAVRQLAFAAANDIAAGLIEASGTFSIAEYPYSETVVVHAGQLTLKSAGQSLLLKPGDGAVIGRGTVLLLEAEAGSRWVFCADIQSVAQRQPGLTALNPLQHLAPSGGPDAEILISPAPQCRSHSAFIEDPTNVRVGIWDSTPYTRHGRPHKLHELMHLIEGRIILRDANGIELVVNTGDTIYVPRGAHCAWQSDIYVRKIYVVK
ncbi:hypothetical protein D9M69_439370 [compost metagenome]